MSDLLWRTAEDEVEPASAGRRRRAREAGRDSDPWLLLGVAALVVFGLVMVYSASSALGAIENNNPGYYLQRQVIWLVIGAVGLAVFRRIDYRLLRRVAYPLAVVSGVLMLMVLVPHIGYEANGARRWFRVGSFLFQPSEPAKIAAILFLSLWLERRVDWVRDGERGLLPFVIMLGATAGLITVLQKDLGTAIVLVAICVAVFALAGARLRHLAMIVGGSSALMIATSLAEPYRLHRLLSFTNPWADPQGSGLQSVQSLIALGRGGLTGAGLGQSIQKFMWLPEAHTDFIFAIIGEEVGLVGTAAVMVGFAVIAWRGYRAAMRAPDLFGMLVAGGVTSWFCIQALINVAAVTDSVPVTGIPLPFVSYGGTSLAASLAAVGILLNIASQGQKVGLKSESFDLGWRDRRPHLSRPRRRSGAAGARP